MATFACSRLTPASFANRAARYRRSLEPRLVAPSATVSRRAANTSSTKSALPRKHASTSSAAHPAACASVNPAARSEAATNLDAGAGATPSSADSISSSTSSVSA